MEYSQRMFELLSEIDRILEERGHVDKIEREIDEGEEIPHMNVFATQADISAESDLMNEVDRMTVLARDKAQKLGFKTSSIRTATDRRACRRFDLFEV